MKNLQISFEKGNFQHQIKVVDNVPNPEKVLADLVAKIIIETNLAPTLVISNMQKIFKL